MRPCTATWESRHLPQPALCGLFYAPAIAHSTLCSAFIFIAARAYCIRPKDLFDPSKCSTQALQSSCANAFWHTHALRQAKFGIKNGFCPYQSSASSYLINSKLPLNSGASDRLRGANPRSRPAGRGHRQSAGHRNARWPPAVVRSGCATPNRARFHRPHSWGRSWWHP